MVKAFGSRADIAHAGGPACLQRRVIAPGHGNELLPGRTQPCTRVVTRACEAGRYDDLDDHRPKSARRPPEARRRSHARRDDPSMTNRRIRWLGVVLVACFLLLFLQLNNFQVREASSLKNNPDQESEHTDPYELPRGDIYSSDDVVLAYSKPTNDGYGELRIYPPSTATLFAGITGYESVAAVDRDGSRVRVRPVPHPAQFARDDPRPAAHPARDDRRHHHHGVGRAPAGGHDGPSRADRCGRRDRPPDRRDPGHVRQSDLQPESFRRPQLRAPSRQTTRSSSTRPATRLSTSRPPRPKRPGRRSR